MEVPRFWCDFTTKNGENLDDQKIRFAFCNIPSCDDLHSLVSSKVSGPESATASVLLYGTNTIARASRATVATYLRGLSDAINLRHYRIIGGCEFTFGGLEFGFCTGGIIPVGFPLGVSPNGTPLGFIPNGDGVGVMIK